MALSDEDKMKMRRLKANVESDSAELERMVNVVSQQFESELDRFIEEVKEMLENKDKMTDCELEEIALKVPVYMYYVAEGMENMGLAYDSSKMTKLEMFNKMYDMADGTIQDKKTKAELNSMPEHYIEIVFSRAYKRIKAKLNVCEHLCLSIRKIIGKRTQDLFTADQEIDIDNEL